MFSRDRRTATANSAPSWEHLTAPAQQEPQQIVLKVTELIDPLITKHAHFEGSRGLVSGANRALSHIAQTAGADVLDLTKLHQAIREFTELFQPNKWTRNERLRITGHLDTGTSHASHNKCHSHHTDSGLQNLIVRGLADCKRRIGIWQNSQ